MQIALTQQISQQATNPFSSVNLNTFSKQQNQKNTPNQPNKFNTVNSSFSSFFKPQNSNLNFDPNAFSFFEKFNFTLPDFLKS